MARRINFGPVDSTSSTISTRARRDTFDSVFAGGFPYSRRLTGHKSCVNTLSFGKGDGRWLASAGDDLRVQVWDFHQEDIQMPSCTLLGPRANVMTLTFSASNRFIYCGGVDHIILKYDMTSLPLNSRNSYQCEQYRHHSDMIRSITSHPYQDQIILSASDDGRILLHDGREENRMTRAQCTLQNNCEFTDVKYHPLSDQLFATSDGHGQVCLRDARMAFGPLVNRTREGIVRVYNTRLSKRGLSYLSNPESSSLTFDREGSKIAVTMLHYLPTIYSVSDPHPIATCSGHYHPDGTLVLPGERTYANSCTMKHGCFGGPGLDTDEYYSGGSDDFRAYVWKIPDIADLMERRIEVGVDDWTAQGSPHNIGFSEGMWEPRYVPADLSRPLFRLNGHNSIVNTTLIHPSFLHILTSGVERHIVLHGVAQSSICTSNMALTNTDVRNLPNGIPEDHERFLRAMTGSHSTVRDGSEESENEFETISLFDQILRQEGNADVFALRQWSPDPSDTDSSIERD